MSVLPRRGWRKGIELSRRGEYSALLGGLALWCEESSRLQYAWGSLLVVDNVIW